MTKTKTEVTFGGSSRQDRAKGDESAEERQKDGEFGRHGAWVLVRVVGQRSAASSPGRRMRRRLDAKIFGAKWTTSTLL